MKLTDITRELVRKWAGAKVFPRGEAIERSKDILQYRAKPGKIEARVAGTQGVYRINIEEKNNEIAATCTCPYEWGPVCKHVAAVMLRWIKEDYELTSEGEASSALIPNALRDVLRAMTPTELTEVICDFALESPEFREALLERFPIPAEAADKQPLQPGVVARLTKEIDGFFKSAEGLFEYGGYYDNDEHPYGWDEQDHYEELASVLKVAQTLHPEDRAAVAWHLVKRSKKLFDDDNAIGSGDIEKAIGLFAEAIASFADETRRRQEIDRLLDVFDWGLCEYSRADEHLIAAIETLAKTNEDRRHVLDRLAFVEDREEADWVAQLSGRLLRDLGDDKAYWELREANLSSEQDYLEFADHLREQGKPEEAHKLLESWLEAKLAQPNAWWRDQGERSVFSELENFYLQQGDDKNLLRILLAKARLDYFDLDLYHQIEVSARNLGQWEETRRELLESLKKRHSFEFLLPIYQSEKLWDEIAAIATDPKLYELERVRAAEMIESERPEVALKLYRSLVDAYIERRGRDNYQQAVHYVKRIQRIWLAQPDGAKKWNQYIASLRAEYPTLRALQEELREL
jgi:hypothetical protein